MKALSGLWWVRLPRSARRISRPLAETLADGHFLTPFSTPAAVLPPLAVLLGLSFGAGTIGYHRAFSESLPLLLLATVGFLSTQLGLLLCIGFALGDFFIGQRDWLIDAAGRGLWNDGLLAGVLRYRLPMLIGYLLLAGLCVYVPRLTRALLADIPGVRRLPPGLAFILAGTAQLVLVVFATRLWAEGTAVLIRPLFTWYRSAPTVAAAVHLQKDHEWIVRAAVLATLVRLGLLWLGSTRPKLRARLIESELRLAAPSAAVQHAPSRSGLLLRAVLAALVATFILAGVIDSWWVALSLFAIFLVLQLLRLGLIPPRLLGWRKLVAKLPLIARVLLATLVAATLRDAFARENDPNFTGLALYVAASVVVLYVLLPGSATPAREVT